MATVLPPPTKRQKREHLEQTRIQQPLLTDEVPEDAGSIRVQFQDSRTGENDGGPVLIPLATSNVKTLGQLVHHLIKKDPDDDGDDDDEDDDSGQVPYKFTLVLPDTKQKIDITSNLYNALIAATGSASTEQIPIIQRTPQAVFKVRPVTRCSASIPGHGAAILAAQFAPNSSRRLVTGSGDSSARIIDCETGTPYKTLKGHSSWVLVASYSPDGSLIATGSHDNTCRLWHSDTGKEAGVLRGHTAFVRGIVWEPYHLQEPGRPRLASCSKDGTVRVWDAVSGRIEHVLGGHKTSVSSVRWGGTGVIFSSSHDKTIKCWDASKGTLIKTLNGHAHQVNHLSLSTDSVLRTGYFDPQGGKVPEDLSERRALAKSRYTKAASVNGKITERLVSASDDNTIYIWDALSDSTKPITRLLGHQKQVNAVTFSPDGALIASCAFDNHTKLWSARDGAFLFTLRGHVGPVYQAAFSADSRLLATCSKDGTVKCWNVATGRLKTDMPGHKDQVFTVDWSPDGARAASGGADKILKIWAS